MARQRRRARCAPGGGQRRQRGRRLPRPHGPLGIESRRETRTWARAAARAAAGQRDAPRACQAPGATARRHDRGARCSAARRPSASTPRPPRSAGGTRPRTSARRRARRTRAARWPRAAPSGRARTWPLDTAAPKPCRCTAISGASCHAACPGAHDSHRECTNMPSYPPSAKTLPRRRAAP
jgi:hypothetical protein